MSDLTEKLKSNVLKLPLLILVVSVLVTIGVTYNFYQSAKSKDTVRFNNEVAGIQSKIENKISLCVALLKGGRGFVESTDNLSRQTFANYVKSLELSVNYAGVQGIGYNKVISPGEKEGLAARMKDEGYTDFKLFPEPVSAQQAIIYLEPLNEKNKKVIGFDMSTEKNRREALERARDTGNAAASAKVFLSQEDGDGSQPGFLIYLPIYKPGSSPLTPADKRQNLIGYIYSPFRSTDFLADVQEDASNSNVALKIYDGDRTSENLLIQTDQSQPANFSEQIESKYEAQGNLNVAGRNWTIDYSSLPAFAAQSSVGWTPLIFLSGMIFSLLMFGTTYWEASARAEMQTIAAELFELEKQKQNLLEKEQKARQSAEQANTTKDEFIAVVSHELRTPLNAIAGWARILRAEDLSSGTRTLALEKVDKNLRLQTQLIEELLEYSQIISEGVSPEPKPVLFSEIFESCCQQISESARGKSIEFVKQSELNGHTLLGDEGKIKIVLDNLLSNAVKFTDAGGRVEAVARIDNGNIQMTVKDTGKGISPEFMPHLFEIFNQHDNSTTRAYGGLGLGLAISHHIVKIHNGTIEAQSLGEGKGATFIVSLPYQI